MRKDNYQKHLLVHSGEKPYKYNVCDKRCSQKGELIVYMRKHATVKPLKCTICNGGFTTKGVLERHHVTHTGVKPYKCSLCDKRFTFQPNLKLFPIISFFYGT